MIANIPPNGESSPVRRHTSLLRGLSAEVDRVLSAQHDLPIEELYECREEVGLKTERVVMALTLESKAKDFGTKMALAVMRDEATSSLIDAKLKAQRIRQLGDIWDVSRVKGLMGRVLALLSVEFTTEPERYRRVVEQLSGIYNAFADVSMSTYTPDQDLHEMDSTIPGGRA